MKTIEEIKIELTLKMLSEEGVFSYDISCLPEDEELRTFVCTLGPFHALEYAKFVDKFPTQETRGAACKYHSAAYWYALEVDRCATPETREASYRSTHHRDWYIKNFGE